MIESSFLELRCKEVINIVDGRRLGHIVDIVFDLSCGKVLGLVVPNCKNFWNVFKNGSELFIPFNQICKIGDDTILVELYGGDNKNCCGNTYVLNDKTDYRGNNDKP